MGPTNKYIPKRKRDPLAVLIGRTVQDARKAKKMAQDELAHESETYRSYLGFIEQGRVNITVRKLTQVCAGLKMKPSELLAKAGL